MKKKFGDSTVWILRYIGPIQLVPTYIQRAETKTMRTKFHQDRFKRLHSVDGTTDSAMSIALLMLIKNICI